MLYKSIAGYLIDNKVLVLENGSYPADTEKAKLV